MTPKLSICIPTFNRAQYLLECLNSVLPQAIKYQNVEVIITDNASEDNTRQIVAELMQNYSFLRYYRNENNLGYTGNQIKCIEYAAGQYMALLCDDDAYTKGTCEEIFKVIDNNVEYAFIALNYYSFLNKIEVTYKTNFAPDHDVLFNRAYDIMNYPSVGHFSGFILNTKIAKETLAKILQNQSFEKYERLRGIIGDIVIRGLLSSDLPAYFIGKRTLAARMPKTVDYDTLYHLCLDSYEYFINLYNNGLITKKDLEYRSALVLGRLPRAIISDGSKLSKKELHRVTEQLSAWFKGNRRFDRICLPLLKAVKYSIIRFLFRNFTRIFRYSKSLKYRLVS